MNIYDIFEDDLTIARIIIKQVEELPYNDFEYNGYQDLADWNLGISNKQYAELLMIKNYINKIEIKEIEQNKFAILVRYNHKAEKLFNIYRDKEYGYYKVDDNPLKDLNKILYYYFK